MGMQLIETIEVALTSVSSITFSEIPQDGVDLVLVLSMRGDANPDIRFNNDSGANYPYIKLYGTGTGAYSLGEVRNEIILNSLSNNSANTTAGTFSSVQITISNYTSSGSKSVSVDGVTENNATSAFQVISAHSWNNSDSVTSIKVFTNPILFRSTASLYKITAD